MADLELADYSALIRQAEKDAKKGRECAYGNGKPPFCRYYLDMCDKISTCQYKRRERDEMQKV